MLTLVIILISAVTLRQFLFPQYFIEFVITEAYEPVGGSDFIRKRLNCVLHKVNGPLTARETGTTQRSAKKIFSIILNERIFH